MNPDTWYHIKAGEIFATHGLLYKDIFSFVGQGRTWFPQEWLFEIILYKLVTLFGLSAVNMFVIVCTLIQLGILFIFLRSICHLNRIFALLIVGVCFVWNLEFYVARPYILATTFFLLTLLWIFRFLRNQNKLWLVLIAPTILIWTNMHASVVFGVYLCIAYAVLEFFLGKRVKAYALGITGFISFILTILPPLGFSQYQLLYMFSGYTKITSYFPEWMPLYQSLPQLSVYVGSLLIICLPLCFLSKKKKIEALMFLPLGVFLLLPFLAVRNLFFAHLVMIIMLGWVLRQLQPFYRRVWFIGIFVLFLITNAGLLYFKWPTPITYPTHAVRFLQQHTLKGNMFNIFSDGGYLIYSLYPKDKVFIDLRTEVYACCELPAYQELAKQSNEPDEVYQKTVTDFFNRYHISFAVVDYHFEPFSTHLGKVLENDPKWSIIFFDDASEIFVRKDSGNNTIIQQFGIVAATPYSNTPYKKGEEGQALREYQRMDTIADSAKARNAIGLLFLKKNQAEVAHSEFEKATTLNPDFIPPYLNLAALAVENKDYEQAKSYYEKVISLDATNGQAYIYLGEIYATIDHDIPTARDTWSRGLQYTQDILTKAKLQNLLNQF